MQKLNTKKNLVNNIIYKDFFNKINIRVVATLPILLITGPFLSDLVVSISSLFFLFFAIKNKNFYYFDKYPIFLFFIFCIFCIVCSLLSVNILHSFESSLFYFRIGIFSCLIWYLADVDKSIFKHFYIVLILCFSALVIDGYSQFFFEKNILGYGIADGSRIASLFGEEQVLGSYLSRLFPLLFAFFLINKHKKFELYLIGVLFILADVLIYISGERTAFFFLNLSTIFIIFFIKKYKIFRLITFLTALALITFITFNNEKIQHRMIKGPADGMGLFNESAKKNIFTSGHDSLIRTSLKMFLDKPIFGHGPKMFRIICKESKYQVGAHPCDTHPHNFYVQLLAETGIIGFSFFFIIFCYVLYCSFRQSMSILHNKKDRFLTDYQVCLLAGILITVWPFSPNGSFFNNWLIIIYSLPFGFYLQSIYSTSKKNSS